MSHAERVRLVDGGAVVAHHDRWVAVHGARHPLAEATTIVAQALGDRADDDLLVVIGLGLGYVVDALEARQWTGRVLAIEPEPELVPHLLARRDWKAWFEADRLRILTAPDFAGAADCWRWFDGTGREPALVVNAPLARVRPEATARARSVLERLRFDAHANARARREHGARYLLNTLGNIPALAREGDVASLTGAAAGVPAIVIGAGPSLDDHLEALRSVGDRAVLIAVDTALRPLLAAGIAPQLVVAVDPAETNARHLTELPPCDTTHLVAEASLDPSAVERFRDRAFLFSVADHEPWPWLRTHGAARGSLRAWGSVLTSAFDLALQMGCNPIVFTGADLAFTGGRPYCRGVSYEVEWRRGAAWGMSYEDQRQMQMDAWPHAEEPDVNGHPTRTAPHLVAFRNWLVEQAGRESSVRFINATGAGILHGGCLEQQPLHELLSTLTVQRRPPGTLVRARYRPAHGGRLRSAAARLPLGADPALETWEQFAEGLTRSRMLDTVARALDEDSTLREAHGGSDPLVETDARAVGHFDAYWIERLAANVPLVRMRVPAQRMEAHRPGIRVFRFRTTTARLIGCVLRLPDDAVTEDGRPLRRARKYQTVEAGEFCAWRDEIVIGSSDGTDPRYNGRTYSMLIPEAVAYAERLPLDEILAHHV